MYRVLFRIIKITIHIKEHLSLEIVFRKGAETIVGKDLYPLVDGIAHINMTNEFLITKQNPIFEVHINFTFKKVKKQAGFIQINLHDWSQGGSYQQIRSLQNSPGGKASIEFGFIYFDSGMGNILKEIQSLEVFEKNTNEQYRCLIEKQNHLLTEKLKELKHQKQQLTEQNWTLAKIEAEYNQIQADLSQQITSQIKKMNESQDSLKFQEEKSNFLMELVRKSGSQNLINSVQGIVKYQMQPQGSSHSI